jgi:drug/metabolite transporter (DMT)-like permease
VCFALTGITTKVLTRRESIVSIMFWLTLLQLVFGAALALWDGVVRWPTAASWPWLVLIGVTGVVAHFCLTSALRLAPASFVMPIDFARLPLIAVAGAVLYGEAIDAAVLAGGRHHLRGQLHQCVGGNAAGAGLNAAARLNIFRPFQRSIRRTVAR